MVRSGCRAEGCRWCSRARGLCLLTRCAGVWRRWRYKLWRFAEAEEPWIQGFVSLRLDGTLETIVWLLFGDRVRVLLFCISSREHLVGWRSRSRTIAKLYIDRKAFA